MKRIISFALLLIALTSVAERLTIVDSEENLPVGGATVFSRTGMIAGVSDDNGVITLAEATAYPLTLRALGYKPAEISAPTDTVRLETESFSLPEVTASAADRPIRRVIALLREYTTSATGNDTMQLYTEYMVRCFVTDREKVKGYKSGDANLTTLRRRGIVRLSSADGRDTIVDPRDNDDMFSFGTQFSRVPGGVIEEPEAIKSGALTDTVAGKYAPSKVSQKSGDLFILRRDLLSDHKGHKWSPTLFKLLGFTMDITELRDAEAFVTNRTGRYSCYDFVYGTFSMKALARGKLFRWILKTKSPITMSCYSEIYPVEITSHSVEEYKQLVKTPEKVEFTVPDYVMPLPEAVEKIIERAKTEL